jgi:hypothetical protein
MRTQSGYKGGRPGGRGHARVRRPCVRRRPQHSDQSHHQQEAGRTRRPRHKGHDSRPLGVASSRVHPEQDHPADAGGQGSRRRRLGEGRGAVPLRAPEPADEPVLREDSRDEARRPSQPEDLARLQVEDDHDSRPVEQRLIVDDPRPQPGSPFGVPRCTTPTTA